ncbi:MULTISPECIES: hypothetical protein [unclassified Streptomyces]|uniref:hypothetical protein n=1 Tax=unclassified Streptomyces TaxID=2593676 RepID=UPI00382D7218
MDRIATPTGVITTAPPYVGLFEDWEREDNDRGPEPEPENLARVIIRRPVIGGPSWR